jgi:hypothetical protein
LSAHRVGAKHTGSALPGAAPMLACVAWYPRFVTVTAAVASLVVPGAANANVPSLVVSPDIEIAFAPTVSCTSAPAIGCVVLQSTTFPRHVCAVAHDATSAHAAMVKSPDRFIAS